MDTAPSSSNDAGDPAATTVAAAYRARITAFYEKYQPEKLSQIDSMMAKYRGVEEQLIQAMVQKYGPEPVSQPIVVAPVSATATAPATSSTTSPEPLNHDDHHDDVRLISARTPVDASVVPSVHHESIHVERAPADGDSTQSTPPPSAGRQSEQQSLLRRDKLTTPKQQQRPGLDMLHSSPAATPVGGSRNRTPADGNRSNLLFASPPASNSVTPKHGANGGIFSATPKHGAGGNNNNNNNSDASALFTSPSAGGKVEGETDAEAEARRKRESKRRKKEERRAQKEADAAAGGQSAEKTGKGKKKKEGKKAATDAEGGNEGRALVGGVGAGTTSASAIDDEEENSWCALRDDRSLFFFTLEHPFREKTIRLINSKAFFAVTMIVILLNCLALSMDMPAYQDVWPQSVIIVLNSCDVFFSVYFTVEMLIKWVALGFVLHPGSYWRSPWNIFDGLITLISVADLILSWYSGSVAVGGGLDGFLSYFITSPSSSSAASSVVTTAGSRGSLSALRTLRILRPLRTISQIKQLRLLLEALFQAIPQVAVFLLVIVCFIFFCSILAIQYCGDGMLSKRCYVPRDVMWNMGRSSPPSSSSVGGGTGGGGGGGNWTAWLLNRTTPPLLNDSNSNVSVLSGDRRTAKPVSPDWWMTSPIQYAPPTTVAGLAAAAPLPPSTFYYTSIGLGNERIIVADAAGLAASMKLPGSRGLISSALWTYLASQATGNSNSNGTTTSASSPAAAAVSTMAGASLDGIFDALAADGVTYTEPTGMRDWVLQPWWPTAAIPSTSVGPSTGRTPSGDLVWDPLVVSGSVGIMSSFYSSSPTATAINAGCGGHQQCIPPAQCLSIPQLFSASPMSFNTIGEAMLVMLKIFSVDNWQDEMWKSSNTCGIGMYTIYLVMTLFGGFIGVNVFLGLLMTEYSKAMAKAKGNQGEIQKQTRTLSMMERRQAMDVAKLVDLQLSEIKKRKAADTRRHSGMRRRSSVGVGVGVDGKLSLIPGGGGDAGDAENHNNSTKGSKNNTVKKSDSLGGGGSGLPPLYGGGAPVVLSTTMSLALMTKQSSNLKQQLGASRKYSSNHNGSMIIGNRSGGGGGGGVGHGLRRGPAKDRVVSTPVENFDAGGLDTGRGTGEGFNKLTSTAATTTGGTASLMPPLAPKSILSPKASTTAMPPNAFAGVPMFADPSSGESSDVTPANVPLQPIPGEHPNALEGGGPTIPEALQPPPPGTKGPLRVDIRDDQDHDDDDDDDDEDDDNRRDDMAAVKSLFQVAAGANAAAAAPSPASKAAGGPGGGAAGGRRVMISDAAAGGGGGVAGGAGKNDASVSSGDASIAYLPNTRNPSLAFAGPIMTSGIYSGATGGLRAKTQSMRLGGGGVGGNPSKLMSVLKGDKRPPPPRLIPQGSMTNFGQFAAEGSLVISRSTVPGGNYRRRLSEDFRQGPTSIGQTFATAKKFPVRKTDDDDEEEDEAAEGRTALLQKGVSAVGSLQELRTAATGGGGRRASLAVLPPGAGAGTGAGGGNVHETMKAWKQSAALGGGGGARLNDVAKLSDSDVSSFSSSSEEDDSDDDDTSVSSTSTATSDMSSTTTDEEGGDENNNNDEHSEHNGSRSSAATNNNNNTSKFFAPSGSSQQKPPNRNMVRRSVVMKPGGKKTISYKVKDGWDADGDSSNSSSDVSSTSSSDTLEDFEEDSKFSKAAALAKTQRLDATARFGAASQPTVSVTGAPAAVNATVTPMRLGAFQAFQSSVSLLSPAAAGPSAALHSSSHNTSVSGASTTSGTYGGGAGGGGGGSAQKYQIVTLPDGVHDGSTYLDGTASGGAGSGGGGNQTYNSHNLMSVNSVTDGDLALTGPAGATQTMGGNTIKNNSGNGGAMVDLNQTHDLLMATDGASTARSNDVLLHNEDTAAEDARAAAAQRRRSGAGGKGDKKRKKGVEDEEDDVAAWRLYLRVTLPKYEMLMLVLTVLNLICLMADHYGIPPLLDVCLFWFSFSCTMVFLVELILKMIAWNPWKLFTQQDRSALVDLIVIVTSMMELWLLQSTSLSSLRVLRLFRLFRLFRSVRLTRHVRFLYVILSGLIPTFLPLLSVVLLMFIWIFVFALMGMKFFGQELDSVVRVTGTIAGTLADQNDYLATQWQMLEGSSTDPSSSVYGLALGNGLGSVSGSFMAPYRTLPNMTMSIPMTGSGSNMTVMSPSWYNATHFNTSAWSTTSTTTTMTNSNVSTALPSTPPTLYVLTENTRRYIQDMIGGNVNRVSFSTIWDSMITCFIIITGQGWHVDMTSLYRVGVGSSLMSIGGVAASGSIGVVSITAPEDIQRVINRTSTAWGRQSLFSGVPLDSLTAFSILTDRSPEDVATTTTAAPAAGTTSPAAAPWNPTIQLQNPPSTLAIILFYCILFFIGNYVIVNLLSAVVIEGLEVAALNFQDAMYEQDVNEMMALRSQYPPRLIFPTINGVGSSAKKYAAATIKLSQSTRERTITTTTIGGGDFSGSSPGITTTQTHRSGNGMGANVGSNGLPPMPPLGPPALNFPFQSVNSIIVPPRSSKKQNGNNNSDPEDGIEMISSVDLSHSDPEDAAGLSGGEQSMLLPPAALKALAAAPSAAASVTSAPAANSVTSGVFSGVYDAPEAITQVLGQSAMKGGRRNARRRLGAAPAETFSMLKKTLAASATSADNPVPNSEGEFGSILGAGGSGGMMTSIVISSPSPDNSKVIMKKTGAGGSILSPTRLGGSRVSIAVPEEDTAASELHISTKVAQHWLHFSEDKPSELAFGLFSSNQSGEGTSIWASLCAGGSSVVTRVPRLVLQGYALWCIGPGSCIRRACAAIVFTIGWRMMSMLIVVTNLIFIALQSPYLSRSTVTGGSESRASFGWAVESTGKFSWTLPGITDGGSSTGSVPFAVIDFYANLFFVLFYIIEVGMKIIAQGFWTPQRESNRYPDGSDFGGLNERFDDVVIFSFCSDGTNITNLLLTIHGFIGIWIPIARIFDSLRALKLISEIPSLRLMTVSVLRTIPAICQSFILCLLIWSTFAVFGVQLWMGTMYGCNDEERLYKEDCTGWFLQPIAPPVPLVDTVSASSTVAYSASSSMSVNVAEAAADTAARLDALRDPSSLVNNQDVNTINLQTSWIITNIWTPPAIAGTDWVTNATMWELRRHSGSLPSSSSSSSNASASTTPQPPTSPVVQYYQNVSREWTANSINFDHFGNALLSLFIVAMGDGWTFVMNSGIDSSTTMTATSDSRFPATAPEPTSVGSSLGGGFMTYVTTTGSVTPDTAPYRPSYRSRKYGQFPVVVIFFLLFVIFGKFFTLNVVMGALVTFFLQEKRKHDDSMLLTQDQRMYLLTKKILDVTLLGEYDGGIPKTIIRKWCYQFCTATWKSFWERTVEGLDKLSGGFHGGGGAGDGKGAASGSKSSKSSSKYVRKYWWSVFCCCCPSFQQRRKKRRKEREEEEQENYFKAKYMLVQDLPLFDIFLSVFHVSMLAVLASKGSLDTGGRPVSLTYSASVSASIATTAGTLSFITLCYIASLSFEFIMKLTAYGIGYFLNRANQFDTVCFSCILASYFISRPTTAWLFPASVILRSLRGLILILNQNTNFQKLLAMVLNSVTSFINVIVLLILVLFIFSGISVQLFSNAEVNKVVTGYEVLGPSSSTSFFSTIAAGGADPNGAGTTLKNTGNGITTTTSYNSAGAYSLVANGELGFNFQNLLSSAWVLYQVLTTQSWIYVVRQVVQSDPRYVTTQLGDDMSQVVMVWPNSTWTTFDDFLNLTLSNTSSSSSGNTSGSSASDNSVDPRHLCIGCHPAIAYPFFVVYLLLTYLVLLQLTAVIIVENLEEVDGSGELQLLSAFGDVRKQWMILTRSTSSAISVDKLLLLLSRISRRITKLRVGATWKDLFDLLVLLRIEITKDLKIRYDSVVSALLLHALTIDVYSVKNHLISFSSKVSSDPNGFTVAHVVAARVIWSTWKEYKFEKMIRKFEEEEERIIVQIESLLVEKDRLIEQHQQVEREIKKKHLENDEDDDDEDEDGDRVVRKRQQKVRSAAVVVMDGKVQALEEELKETRRDHLEILFGLTGEGGAQSSADGAEWNPWDDDDDDV